MEETYCTAAKERGKRLSSPEPVGIGTRDEVPDGDHGPVTTASHRSLYLT